MASARFIIRRGYSEAREAANRWAALIDYLWQCWLAVTYLTTVESLADEWNIKLPPERSEQTW